MPRLLRFSCCLALVGVAVGVGSSPAGSQAPARKGVLAAIDSAQQAGLIPAEHADVYRNDYALARSTLKQLEGKRRKELRAVVQVTIDLAKRDELTSSRMPLVFTVLRRNTEWWSRQSTPRAGGSPGEKGAAGRRCKPIKASAARVTFDGSELLFQHYPGQGLQFHPNGTFAKLNSLVAQETPEADARASALADELVAIGSRRRGALVWEHLLPFGGGRPPWISALAQGTAIKSLTAAAARLNRPELLETAKQAAGSFSRRPAGGLAYRFEKDGSWYLLYSFKPYRLVLNAHLQAVIGLHDLYAATADEAVGKLYKEGLRAARRRIGKYDTGKWSRYAYPGQLATLNYHVLNRDLARSLCKRSNEKPICRAADHFTRQLDRRCPKKSTPARRS